MARPKHLKSLTNNYLKKLQTKGFMKSTLCTYRSTLNHFVTWASEQDITTTKQLTNDVIHEYLLLLRRKGFKVSGRLSTLKGFGQWLHENKQTPNILFSNAEVASYKPTPSQVMTHTEIEQVFAAIDTDSSLGLRDRAILEVLFSSGLRRSELRALKLLDIDVQRGVLFVRQGKNRKDRIVPISDRALYWLNRYIQEIRSKHTCTDTDVFLSRFGHPLSDTAILTLCKKHVKAAGINKRGHPHAFRHAAGTALLEAGASLRHVQAFLGHEDIRTTTIYTQVTARKLREVYRSTHPFEADLPKKPE